MSRWIVVTACLLLSQVVHAAATACIPADIRLDASGNHADIRIALPKDIRSLALIDLTPLHRPSIWTSPDGSAHIQDNQISAADPGHRLLYIQMDVHAMPEREDRAYAPFLRYTDGTVVIRNTLFKPAGDHGPALCPRFHASIDGMVAGFGQSRRDAIALDVSAPDGYVALGHPQIKQVDGLTMIVDRGLASWVVDDTVRNISAISAYYAATLGKRQVPTIFLYLVHGQGKGYHGDHQEAALSLAVEGDDWKTPDPAGEKQLLGFLAHEIFHTWNAGPALGSPEGEALLAKEGGAEFARVIATALVLKQDRATWLGKVSDAYDRCLAQLPKDRSLAAALNDARAPGSLPYDCGVPLMFALAVAQEPGNPAHGYLELWRQLQHQAPHEHGRDYRWQDLMPALLSSGTRQALLQATADTGGYANGMSTALAQLHYDVRVRASISASGRQMYAQRQMARLMSGDCGSVSMWTLDDGFMLDKLPNCHALVPGKVTSIAGIPIPGGEPAALQHALDEHCGHDQVVAVGYDGKQPAISVACKAPVSAAPQEWDILPAAEH
ncbi:hypothetical protein [Dyella sp.]|uniref:hypothetical protein n=1 Tax=Dyella sp. TaxID=1869338 RepID=UPI002ED0FD4F